MSKQADFRMFTINEAAEYFGISKYFVRQLVLTKKIPSVNAGKKYLINEKILKNYLKSGAELDKV